MRTNEGDVIFGVALGGQALCIRQTAEGRYAREHGVSLSATVTWQSVVPESLVRAAQGALGIMGAMTSSNSCPKQGERRLGQHRNRVVRDLENRRDHDTGRQ